MRTSGVAPSGVERTFGDDEIIVSKTDTRGRLTYVNDVFVRVSAYPESDLIGRPHNVIRHPDMPRAVFRLLWETIGAGRELFAYIVNLAGDGAHYWVLAHVTPTFGPGGDIVGFHSNRRTPSREALDRVTPLYQALLAEERRHPHPPDALAASTAMLAEHLAATGQTYDEWVWSLDRSELVEVAR
ncbi:MAG TPA: PAS domain-containing protein [Acidimicrobiia bacterium]|nr:PAS domain-containing protein [Acidimicrobiia bacterium]